MFVTTSLLDSFGMVIVEAVAQGTPSLYPEWIGIAEYLRGPGTYALASIEPAEISRSLNAALAGPRVPLDALSNLRWRSVLDTYGEVIRAVHVDVTGGHEAAA